MKNLNQLKEKFTLQFGSASDEIIINAAVDNMLYMLSPVQEREKLPVNKAYILNVFAEIESQLEALITRGQETIQQFKALENNLCYTEYVDHLSKILHLRNRVEARAFDQAVAFEQVLSHALVEASLHSKIVELAKGVNGNLLADLSNTEKLYEISYCEATTGGVARTFRLGTEMAYDPNEALLKFMTSRSDEALRSYSYEPGGTIKYHGNILYVNEVIS